MNISEAKIAWLVPSAIAGGYFGPLIAATSRLFSKSVFFTGRVWPGANETDFGAAKLQLVGKTGVVRYQKNNGYGLSLTVASPAIVWEIAKYQPDIVIANGFSIWTLLALLVKPLFGWKIVVILDGISISTRFECSKPRLASRQMMSAMVDAFVANSQAAAQYLIKTIGISKSKVFHKTYIVPSLSAIDRSSVIQEKVYKGLKILYVGRLTRRKGVRTLIEACALLNKLGQTNYSLILVGDGDERVDLEELVISSNISNNVDFVGWLDYGEIGHYLRAADVFVLPSFEDTWGAVLLEAMAFGKPVISSKMAGASETVVEGKNGFIFDPRSSDELAEKLDKFIQSPTLAAQMGKVSKAIAAKHSIEDTATFFAELSKSLLSG